MILFMVFFLVETKLSVQYLDDIDHVIQDTSVFMLKSSIFSPLEQMISPFSKEVYWDMFHIL